MGKMRELYQRYRMLSQCEAIRSSDRQVAVGLSLATELLVLLVAVQWVPEWQVRRAGVRPAAVAEKAVTQADVTPAFAAHT